MKKILALFLLLFSASGCATVYDPVARRDVRTLYSLEQEIKLGSEIAGYIEKEFEVCEPSGELLREIGERVAESSERPYLDYSFKVLKSDGINAFALPGGFIYVYSGLFEALNDDELAAVLGHEIAHVAARHGIKRMQAVYGYQLLSIAGLIAMHDSVDPAAAYEVANSVFTLVLLGYSRKDEFEADRLGTRYAALAGFDPAGMLGVLEKLEEKQRVEPLIPFLHTHPPLRDRMREVRIVMAALEADNL
jgi:beta-barrel assembly-enhancing protease